MSNQVLTYQFYHNMPQHNKEHLRKLLTFLNNEIIHEPENEWFVDELYRLLPQKELATKTSSEIQRVEKYLGLDFKLDDSKSIIDYSFINDAYLRDCFEADCREMLRNRFGTRGHIINFPEFCRYALIQAERLLNVYYSTKGTFEQIKGYIKLYNSSANLGNSTSLDSISFAVKLWAYINEFHLKPVYNVFDKVRMVRNAQSHGSGNSDPDNQFFQRHYYKLLSEGYPLLPSGFVNWSELKKNPELNNKYEREVKTSEPHKRYMVLVWQQQLPFDEVITALEVLSMHVSKHI